MAFESLGLLFVFLLIGGVAALFAYWFGLKRKKELTAQALALGLAFEPRPAERLEKRFQFLSVIDQGHSRRARNLMHGTYRGHDVQLFDYHFTTGGGKHQQHHVLGVAIADLGTASPWLRIVPETWDKKLWDALGGDDIDFESDEFSRRFWVKAEDRRFAYDVIHARMMEFLMTPGWSSWELRGGHLCVWQRGRYTADAAPGILDRLLAFQEQVPARLGLTAPSTTPGARP